MSDNYNNKGRIAIYGFNGRILDSQLYYSRNGRREIIAKWKEDWASLASHIHVLPFALCKDEPKEVKRRFIKVDVPAKPRLMRPLSKYNNIPSPYGIAIKKVQ